MLGLNGKGRLQMEVAAGLRREHGLGFFEARRLASTVDEDALGMAAAMCSPEAQEAYKTLFAVGAVGDWVQKIIDFFKSPLGQQILSALMALLLGLI